MIFKFAFLFAVVTAGTLVGAPEAKADYYSWSSNGNCIRYNGAGVARDQVSDHFCGKDYYGWSSNGNCLRFNGAGVPRDQISDHFCGKDYFAWSSNGNCIRYNGTGVARDQVSDSFCDPGPKSKPAPVLVTPSAPPSSPAPTPAPVVVSINYNDEARMRDLIWAIKTGQGRRANLSPTERQKIQEAMIKLANMGLNGSTPTGSPVVKVQVKGAN